MDIFSKQPGFESFKLFGTAHIVTVFMMSLLLVVIYKKFKDKTYYKYVLIISLLVLDIGFRLWAGFYETPNYVSMFSVHISSAAVILSVWCLVKFNQRVFDVLFYWGLLFVPQAIITPGIVKYGFPHMRFFHIFLIHFLVINTIVYLLLVEKRRLSRHHFIYVLITTHLYSGFVWLVNNHFGTNYMFINRASNFPSLLNYLGPYPHYLISLDIIMIVLFLILNRIYVRFERGTYESL